MLRVSRRTVASALSVLSIAVVLLGGACARREKINLAELPKTFQARMKPDQAASGPFKADDLRIYRMGQNVRLDIVAGSRKNATIFNADRKKAYQLSFDQKAYIEAPVDEKQINAQDPVQKIIAQPDTKIEEIGDETVDGHPCRKVKVTAKIDGRPQTGFLWCASDLRNFPVKVEMVGENGQGVVTTFSDVKFEVDPKLFLPPDDFTELTRQTGRPSGPPSAPPDRSGEK